MIEFIILSLALLIDLIFGDPPNRYHTTALLGRLIAYLKPRLKDTISRNEIIKGMLASILVISIAALAAFSLSLISSFLDYAVMIVIDAIALKMTIAIKSMKDHAKRVIEAIMNNDIEVARMRVSMIVGRDTSNLDEEHILSAVIESISENTTDGITSAIFYYSLFGLTGAFAYRAINTLDSMLGYKDDYHKNIGYFAAKLDTIANFIPSRLTGLLTILAAMILKMRWKDALMIIKRDSKNTPSLNAGWSMAGVAGALGVELEKIGYYKIGEPYEKINVEHCYKAMRIMEMVTILFIMIIALPLIIIRVYLGLGI